MKLSVNKLSDIVDNGLCVGCGICSAVCPRGVLKLENGPEEGRINPTEILLGNDVDLMELVNKK